MKSGKLPHDGQNLSTILEFLFFPQVKLFPFISVLFWYFHCEFEGSWKHSLCLISRLTFHHRSETSRPSHDDENWRRTTNTDYKDTMDEQGWTGGWAEPGSTGSHEPDIFFFFFHGVCDETHSRRGGRETRLPGYLGALPAGPNDRHRLSVPRLLLQLTQLSPGLTVGGAGGGSGSL